MARTSTCRELDRLYAASFEEFTATRDEIAERLRDGGDEDRAEEVKRLRKPTVPAWAINQASRRSAKAATALTKAGADLRKAQEGLRGTGGRDRFRSAQRRVREAVRELREEAEAALGDEGRSVSAAVGEQIDQTLQAAALDPDVGELVEQGRLQRPEVAVGFPGVAPEPAGDADGGKASASRDRQALEKRLRREQDRLAEATEKRQAAEAGLRDAELAVEAAAKELKGAERRLVADAEREAEASERVERLREELDGG